MKRLLLFVASACMMFSCAESGDVIPEVEKIPINISVGQQTRANDEAFENGDEVGIYVVNYSGETAGTLAASGNQVDNAQFAYDGSKWSPENSIYWKDGSTAADFYAYYPYSASPNISAHPFSVAADQSEEADFWASDFLWGKTTKVLPTPNAVAIQTNHSLSRILLGIEPGNGFTEESWEAATKSVKICNVKTNATINLANGIATATGDAGEIVPFLSTPTRPDVKPSYSAMMVPQTIADNSKLIVVTVDGIDYVYRSSKGFAFQANTKHRFVITVNKSGSNVDVSIGEWAWDDNPNIGEAYEESASSAIPNNEIWYTATAKVEPNDANAFGATIQRNEWDSATGKGVITFDGDVTSIGSGAFVSCNCTDIVLPNSVISIGDTSFAASSITSIVIPNGVQTIEANAFRTCSSLENVYFKSTTPPTIGEYVFVSVWSDEAGDWIPAENLKIYVPAASVNSYKEASDNWIALADKIFADPTEN
ncbi:MAG: fimbrillin family protein [Alistipes sp.]|nr:fimbrillin family protein [Alistipes sp.]